MLEMLNLDELDFFRKDACLKTKMDTSEHREGKHLMHCKDSSQISRKGTVVLKITSEKKVFIPLEDSRFLNSSTENWPHKLLTALDRRPKRKLRDYAISIVN